MTFQKRHFVPSILLNTALCQAPPTVSKTKKALNYIKHFALVSRFQNGQIENGIHHITCIATNKSLLETKQWKIRVSKDLKGLNVIVLSSKKGDVNNINTIISHLARAKKADDLPDIIIMCTHSKRTDDLVELIAVLNNGNLNFNDSLGIKQVTMTAMFDEADQNIELITYFINNMEAVINKDGNHAKNYTVRDIHLITATPYKEFWSELEKKCGIKKLDNINKILKENPDSDLHISYNDLMKGYRKIDDHTVQSGVVDDTRHPYDYAKKVLCKIKEENRTNKVLTVFAPSEFTTESHERMRDVFILANFTVAIMNGTKKGFYSSGSTMTFDAFNKKHGVTGELRDTLVKWRELNPDTDLAITGFLNVQRGVTFNTTGFNFTDLILSKYHLNNMASLVQILGRANGGVEYVKIMNIWSPKEVIEAANEQISVSNTILEKDPEEFKESDFRKRSKAEILEPALRIPSLVKLTEEEYNSITKVGREWDTRIIFELIGKYNAGLAEEIKKLKKDQITEPGAKEGKTSVKKQVTDLLVGIQTDTKKVISVKKDHKDTDVYQIFMDKSKHQLIVCTYYGTCLTDSNDNGNDSDSIDSHSTT